jgi:ABC-type branched-subunit amino acid transport system substrate-binding protein/tetratricopeptide (TPR) repeat protein
VRRLLALGGVLPVLGLASACAVLPGPEPVATEDERREYAAALVPLASNPRKAQQGLEAFLQSHPESPLADDAALRLGELASQRKDTEGAVRYYRRVVVEHPRGDRVDSARLALARVELARGNRAAAESVLRPMRLQRLSPEERQLAYRAFASLADEPDERLRWLSRVRAGTSGAGDLAAVDAEIDRTLGEMDARALMRVAAEIEPNPPAGRALLRAAELALEAGDPDAAGRALERAMRLPLLPEEATRLRSLEARARLRASRAGVPAEVHEALTTLAQASRSGGPATAGAAGTLGAVLPLSGRLARFGEESLQGILLAAGVFGADGDGRRVRVVVRDSGGDPQRAALAVAELAAIPDVVGIVGPLLAAESEAAAAAAEAAGIPLVSLAAREEGAEPRPRAFRVRALPREEVELLVEHAMGELGGRRFAVLYPRDAYGRGLRRLFWEAVEARGGEIVAVASYEPSATDFGSPIRSLLGYDLLSAAEKQVLAKREEMESKARRLPPAQGAKLMAEARALTGPDGAPLPPILDFDALFIPESHEKVVLIAPQLAFHDARGIRLLGTGSWNHPDLVAIGRDHVDGARFTAGFFAGSPLPIVQRFAAAYEEAYAVPPVDLAAQGYDAANLLLVQLARGFATREAALEGLLEVDAQPGVTGVLSLANGSRKRPLLLGVDRGQIVEIE